MPLRQNHRGVRLRAGRDGFVDRVRPGDDRDGSLAMTADAERRGDDVVHAGDDRRAGRQTCLRRRFRRNAPDDLIGTRDGGQRAGEALQAEDGQDVGRVGLAPHLGEGGAGFRQVGPDRAGQAEAQPVLAGEHMGDAGKALGLMAAYPGEQRRRRRRVSHLAGALQRGGGGAVALPLGNGRGGAAVERQDAVAERPAVGIEKIDAVAVRRRRHGGDIARRAARQAKRLGDGLGRRLPQRPHVALDVARARDELRHAPPRD